MSSAGEAAPSKNKGEKTIWKVSATIANKRAVRMRGPAEIVMVFGFIPPAPLSNIIAHAESSHMPREFRGQTDLIPWENRVTLSFKTEFAFVKVPAPSTKLLNARKCPHHVKSPI